MPALGLGAGSVVDKIYARERELVEQERAKRPVIPCEVQAIRIGDLGIVTNGASFFASSDSTSRPPARSRGRGWSALPTTGSATSPTPSAYYAGGYEPRTARSAKMAAWAGQSLVEGSLAALKRAKCARATPEAAQMIL